MKYRIILIISLLMIISFIAVSTALAEERVKVIEMGESGQTVEFPMTPKEIASEDAEFARLDAIRQANRNKPKERMQATEMGESGQIVEFPMSPEEIASENQENARLAAIRKAKLKNSQKHVVAFELAESGIVIEFSDTTSDINADKTAE